MTELAKTTGTTVGPALDFGQVEIEAKDLIIPTARIIQKMSKALDSNREWRAGEIRDSLSGALLGDETEPLSVVIFKHSKRWGIYDITSGDSKWVRFEPYTPENSTRSWEFKEGGMLLEAKEIHDFTCLNVKDPSFPIVFPMMSTAVKAARRILTVVGKLQNQAKAMPSVVFEIRSAKREEKGIYWVPEVTLGPDTSPELLQTAHDWWLRLKTASVVVAHPEEESTPAPFKADEDEIPF